MSRVRSASVPPVVGRRDAPSISRSEQSRACDSGRDVVSCCVLLSLMIKSSHRRLPAAAKRDPEKDIDCVCPNRRQGFTKSLFHGTVQGWSSGRRDPWGTGCSGKEGRRGTPGMSEDARLLTSFLAQSRPCRLHRDVRGTAWLQREREHPPPTARRWLSPPRGASWVKTERPS